MIGPAPRRSRGPGRAPGDGGPEAAGAVLARVLRGLRLEERRREGALASAWDAAAGEDLAVVPGRGLGERADGQDG